MERLFSQQRNPINYELLCSLLIGAFLSLIAIKASGMGGKWLKIIFLGTFGFTGLIIAPSRERIALYTLIFFLPFSLNFHLVYVDEPIDYIRNVHGFRVAAIDILLGFCILCWIVRLFNSRELKIDFFPGIAIPFLLIFILSAIGLKLADNISTILAVSSLWVMLKMLVLFLYLGNNLQDKEVLYGVLAALLATSSLQALIGIGQYLKGGTLGLQMLGEVEIFEMTTGSSTISRIGGTLGHANQYAIYMGLIIQVNIGLLFSRLSKMTKFLLAVSLGLLIASLILTFSRGGTTGMVMAAGINLWWCISKKNGRKFASAVGVFFLIATVAALGLATIKPLQRRFFEDDRGSSEIREPMREVARNMIEDNPFFGVGLNNYTTAIYRYDTTSMAVSYNFSWQVHDELYLIAAEMGLPVFLLFFCIIGFTFHRLLRLGISMTEPILSYLSIGFFCGFLTYFFQLHYDYTYVFLSYNLWIYIGIILAMSAVALHRQDEDHSNIAENQVPA